MATNLLFNLAQRLLQLNMMSSCKALLCDHLNTCKRTFLEDYSVT